jgi:hypothetical protein
LTANAVDPGGSRTDPTDIVNFLDSYNPMVTDFLPPSLTVALDNDTGLDDSDGITFELVSGNDTTESWVQLYHLEHQVNALGTPGTPMTDPPAPASAGQALDLTLLTELGNITFFLSNCNWTRRAGCIRRSFKFAMTAASR